MRRPPHRESVRAAGARCLDTQYGRSLEPVPEAIEARGESKSAVSRRFVRHGEKMLSERLAARLDGFDLVALLIDGLHFDEHAVLCAAEDSALPPRSARLSAMKRGGGRGDRTSLIRAPWLASTFAAHDPRAPTVGLGHHARWRPAGSSHLSPHLSSSFERNPRSAT